ncbi:MAG: RNA polymerase sigma factor [Erysipelotrichaceae bacterium]|nr:RNA polymerase sigma factor [Erysipelotrichaceae bacterium]
MDTGDLEQLIQNAKEGDDQAFREIYNLTYRKAMVIAKTFMKDDDKANEALQLSYIKLSKKLDTVENVETFYAWFNTIVTNTCKDQLKKHHDFSFTDYENGDDDLAIDVEDEARDYKPDESVKYDDDRAVVLGFINELPTEQRSALVMQIYEGMKISEIADFFETSESTIKSRLNYAKKTIKQKVEDYKKAGNTLFVLPLIVYLKGIFDSYEKSIVVSEELYASIATEVATTKIPEPTNSSSEIVKESTKGAAKILSSNVVKGVIAGALVVGGAGGYIIYSNSGNVIELLTENTINYELTGVNGNATIEATLNYDAIDYDTSNDDITEFLADITFTYDKQEELSNGDTVTITANYDEEKANDLGLKINDATYTVTIEDLSEYYQTTEEVPNEILAAIRETIEEYLAETSDTYTYAYYAQSYEYVSTWLGVNENGENKIIMLYKETDQDLSRDYTEIIYVRPDIDNVGPSYLEEHEEFLGFDAIYDSEMNNPHNLKDAIEVMKEQLSDYELTQFEE